MIIEVRPPARPSQGPRQLPYDLERELALDGRIATVKLLDVGPGNLVCLAVEACGKTFDVILCPKPILEEKALKYAAGDAVVVLCAPFHEYYRARKVTRGADVLVLVDEHGKPLHGRKPYALDAELQLQGVIESLNRHEFKPGRAMYSFLLAHDGGKTEIALGPEPMLQALPVKLVIGDHLTVLCAPSDKLYQLRQIVRGDDTLIFKDSEGKPLQPAA